MEITTNFNFKLNNENNDTVFNAVKVDDELYEIKWKDVQGYDKIMKHYTKDVEYALKMGQWVLLEG